MEMNKQMILPVVLRGNNYLLWSRTTKTALRSRGLWSYVDNPKETPKDGVTDPKWDQEDQQVLAVLQSSLEPSILAAYSHHGSAKELWDALKVVYGDTSNLSRIFEVKKALNDLQQEGKAFKDLFGMYNGLWAELEMLRPPTMDQKVLNERKEQDQVFGLLLTLNDTYKDLIQHILRIDKLPTLNEVCAMIQKEEGARSLFKPPSEMAHIAQRTQSYGERKSFFCDHCKMKGHTKEKCWTLHPHLKPAHLRGQGRGQGAKYFAGTTSYDNDQLVRKSDLEALIQGISKLTSQGKNFYASKSKEKLIVDSGASHNMVNDVGWLKNVEPHGGNVMIADGKQIGIKGIGDLEVLGKSTKALLVPDCASNLLSVHKTTKDLDCKIVFATDCVEFQDSKTKQVIGVGGVQDGLYLLNKDGHVGESFIANKVDANSWWHSRLGHPSHKVLSMILPSQSSPMKECEACVLGKQTRRVFSDSTSLYKECFELVHSDVWTAPCISKDQYKYFVSFIDHKSKYTWVTLLRSKSGVYEAFVNLYNYVSTQFGKKIKVLRSDNGGEYMSNEFKRLLSDKGIVHQTSCAYTPQQNGVSERKNRHLLEVARTIMFERGVPKSFWGDAVMTACYLINRLPTENLEKKSPFEVLNGEKPVTDHLRVFGCTCYVLRPEMQRNKLEPKSLKCVFVGYSSTQKGYKCFHPETNRIYVSREVQFEEEVGFFAKKEWKELDEIVCSGLEREQVLRSIIWDGAANNNDFEAQGDEKESLEGNASESTSPSNEEGDSSRHETMSSQTESTEEEGHSQQEEDEITQEPEPTLRRSQRIRHGPRVYYNCLAESVQQEVTKSEPLSTMSKGCTECTTSLDLVPIGNNVLNSSSSQCAPKETKSAKKEVKYPIEAYCSLAHLSKENQVFVAQIEGEQIPNSYEEACGNNKWVQAMEEEIGSMERNRTWNMVELPRGKKLVGCRWVYTIKYKSNGEVERYKARLVAKGYTQVYGEDYTETFAPVAKLHSVRVLLSIAVNLSWDLWQMDVRNAFLQGDLEEEVFMIPPQGYEKDASKVCRLNKAIYGLKQSPRAWYQRLSSYLLEEEFSKSEADHTLFTKRSKRGLVAILIYVDDIIITGDDGDGIRRTKELLKSAFDIKDLGELKYFLGIEMNRESDGLFISQRKYTLDLLKETGKLASKPAKTPIEEGYKDEKEEELWEDVKQYQRLVGKLIYLTITRPDICFAVNRVSQHMQAPKKHHWNMVERILRYLKGNPGKGIFLKCNGSTMVEAYCDADWAGDTLDRKSTTGYCTFVGGNLVTWRSKKQKVIALSSAEAEYRAMKEVTKEMVWLKKFFADLGVNEGNPMSLYCDNQAAIHIASNPVFHERTKHIEVDCHFIRGKIQEGLIKPKFVKSGEQLADIFTKATNWNVCEYVHDKIGLSDPLRPILRGSVENHAHTQGELLNDPKGLVEVDKASRSSLAQGRHLTQKWSP